MERGGGRQPMTNEDGTVWIVFNGEIYNHRPLRRRLVAHGHRFRTHSDTETILHAYEEYGTACVDHLEGMFAFAVYDTKTHDLFIARDRLGKKPLFWGILSGVLHFGSEIKAIAASPAFDDSVDASGLEAYLSLGYILAPQTIYKHVHKLEPGHWLRMQNGRVTTKKYWDIEQFDVDRRPGNEIAEELGAMIHTAVRDRLESEVPLGAFLSGGIDSALCVSYMAEAAERGVVTTSVGFGESAHNELGAAGASARHLGTTHHPEVVTPRLDQILDRIVGSFDEPFADASAIPTYYVSAMARRHVTVALSGDGGDEMWSGYTLRYVPHALEGRVSRMLGRAGRPLARMGALMWPRSTRLPRPLRLGRTLENLSGDRATAYYNDLCFMRPSAARRLLGLDPAADITAGSAFQTVTEPYRRCTSSNDVQRAEYADLKIYLPNDVLVKVDRMSMAHGLEVRCPLLDRRIVEFAFRVPVETKMPQLQTKAMLRRVAQGRIPDEILNLPKHGFTAPVSEWMAGPYAGRFEDEVLGGDSRISALIDTRRVAQLFHEHRARTRDNWYELWSVWMLERWARQQREPATALAAGEVA
jgi:asparagine synthase (glutamine-hydrolysing)